MVAPDNTQTVDKIFSNIQALRAVAATAVFFFHAAGHYQALNGALVFFKQIASIGFLGVDIFFVISGFVVAHTTFARARSFANARWFVQRRLLRIYLGYWPFFILIWCLTAVYDPIALGEMQLWQSFFLMTIDAKSMVVFVSWSLTFEIACYLLASLTVVLPTQVATWVAYGLSAVILLLMLLLYGEPHSGIVMFLAFFLEFLAGMMIYIHRKSLKCRLWIAPLALATLVAFSMGGYLHATNDSGRLFTFGTGAVALVMLALVLEQSASWTANKAWVAFGDASYTLYLLHPAMLTVFYFWHFRDFLALQPVLIRETGFFIYLGFSWWVARVIYIGFERPIYRWVSNTHKPAVAGKGSADPSS